MNGYARRIGPVATTVIAILRLSVGRLPVTTAPDCIIAFRMPSILPSILYR
ncbi:hypothetical protein D3C74_496220 [compost metagenome]